MTATARRLLFVVIGGAFLLIPLFLRWFGPTHESTYVPPDLPPYDSAATPEPTWTPVAVNSAAAASQAALRPGPVVVDLAHFNRLDRSTFQPLAATLASHGVGLRFWLPEGIDPFQVQSLTDLPDQSTALRTQLADASALVVASPFFLWSVAEINVAREFVADGGRLLLISDPDVVGDVARDINNVGEPFGVVFNDDYLYDVAHNDENYTYIFQAEFRDTAAALSDHTIVLYGARSISGAVEPQVRSADTTLSSTRPGLSQFTTVALGGLESNGTAGRVLAMSDIDVLGVPFVDRHDNRHLLAYVADFLAGATRKQTVVDFPATLGKEVALVYGSAQGLDAKLLMQSAQLQQRLERTGRELSLARTALITDTAVLSTTVLRAPDTDGIVDAGTAITGMTAMVPGGVYATPFPPATDLIYLGDFRTALTETTILADAGFTLVEVTQYSTPGASATPTQTAKSAVTPATATQVPSATPTPSSTATPSPSATATVIPPATPTATPTATDAPFRLLTPAATAPTPPTTAAATITATVSTTASLASATPTHMATNTVTPTLSATPSPTATVTPTPTPRRILYLESQRGLRLLADETVLILQQTRPNDGQLIAVLGSNADHIDAGVARLLNGYFGDCVLEDARAICPVATATHFVGYAPGGDGEDIDLTPTPSPTPVGAVPEVPATPLATQTPGAEPDEPDEPGDAGGVGVLVIDDNDDAAGDEDSEAEHYLRILTDLGHAPDIWRIADAGRPAAETLNQYAWVIWSSGGYAVGGPDVSDLDPLFGFINEGGHLTISSRTPFFGEGQGEASVIQDVVTTDAIPGLVRELPTAPIALTETEITVTPLQANPDENPNISIVLRRGPDSAASDSPLLFVIIDNESAEATGARLMVLGMSIAWLPDHIGEQLVENIATYMLAGG